MEQVVVVHFKQARESSRPIILALVPSGSVRAIQSVSSVTLVYTKLFGFSKQYFPRHEHNLIENWSLGQCSVN